ncbi:TIGR04211 family SH3 domain-containing protein [Pseudoalteromonas rubra]|uniref:TIGR04211 family SH3 domain-containing protein n=1 Tax=Pseudoalteromonas rubra TaxID=43658 RepID=A0A5S3WI65_9GAMM|nr:TIGR04211 family SH3 domain-containing protein [Pseudoalteromonas rubra]TMP25582.1 TIGR04211 family SH3 domain-containing protein [Pseudoalteromonas rubra]TMP31005.1 TIGR04211 family SH3 domain-containing protein [Pseudoalteromonas rubra]
MLKNIALPLLLSVLSLSAMAEQTDLQDEPTVAQSATDNNGYIVDDLYLFMHTGPGKNYRILGSVEAGTPITILNSEQDDYIQIKDDKDREGWVQSQFVTSEPGLRQRLASANQALSDNNAQLNALQSRIPQLEQANLQLQQDNTALKSNITELEQALEAQVQASLNKSQTEQHMLLSYGGGIGIAGILIGVILTLVLSRRKRYDGWA